MSEQEILVIAGILAVLALGYYVWYKFLRPRCSVCGRQYDSKDDLYECDVCHARFCANNIGQAEILVGKHARVSSFEIGGCGSTVFQASGKGTSNYKLCAHCLRRKMRG